MNIKRFLAPDMRRAIQKVRNEHGPDAVILSSQSVDGGIEIIAAGEYDPNLVACMATGFTGSDEPRAEAVGDVRSIPPQRNEPKRKRRAKINSAPAVSDIAPKPLPSTDQDLRVLHQELRALKGIVSNQFARLSWADLRSVDPKHAVLLRRAEELGLERSLAEQLVNEVVHTEKPDAAWRDMVFALARRVQVMRRDPLEQGGVFALVGPTGVGKTTTIAKIAARHCLRYGRDSLALVTTDNYRIGAYRQLDAFGAILSVPVRRVEGAEELSSVLHELSKRRLVLIDTAGMAPRCSDLADSMRQLDSVPDIRRFLVLPVNMQVSAMHEAVRCFGGRKLAGVVLTKLDEADGLGAALSVLAAERLPVAWISEGQRVPEDLRLARIAHLIKCVAVPGEDELTEPGLIASGLAKKSKRSETNAFI